MGIIQNEKNDISGLLSRIKTRNFTGNTGQAIKNSSFQFLDNLILKGGSFIFTIILARILLPNLFGLYSLALSTIVFFAAFSDPGITQAILTFVSKKLGEKDEVKAKAYVKKLFKWKLWISIGVSAVLAGSAYFIANFYYNKPIFLALVAGAIYLFLSGIISFFQQIFRASNNFKNPAIADSIFQISRIIVIPLLSLLVLKLNFSKSDITSVIILALSFSYLLAGIYLFWVYKRKKNFLQVKSENLDAKDKKELKRFIVPLLATVLSGVFFGYIDTIMLGHFVTSEFISYYSTAFNLIASASTIIGFTYLSLFPLFSQLEGKALEKMFRRSRNLTLLISLIFGIISFAFAGFIIRVAYGSAYLNSVPVLRYFSILLIISPVSNLYNTYLVSRKETSLLAKLLIASTVINIVLNLAFITYGLRFSQLDAIIGACIATIIARLSFFGGVAFARRRKKTLNMN